MKGIIYWKQRIDIIVKIQELSVPIFLEESVTAMESVSKVKCECLAIDYLVA